MSYSFGFTVSTKEEAKARIAAEVAKVVAGQPVHNKDQAQAIASANSFIDLVVEDPAKDITVNMNGSIGWNGPEDNTVGVALAFSIYQVPRKAA